uniref:Lysozyme g n=1 Tax=Poecilia reticulata TaxID=8081 RepID=A0A3P9PKF0_POERE
MFFSHIVQPYWNQHDTLLGPTECLTGTHRVYWGCFTGTYRSFLLPLFCCCVSEYRNLSQMTTTGASKITKERNIDMSKTLAEQDLELMSKYKTDIKSVGKALRLHPALIAAIISKQSRAGGTLDCKGYGKLDSVCFGLMQVCIHKDHHELKGTAFSREHIEQGSTCLIHLIKDMKNRKPDWSEEMQLKGEELTRVPLAQPDHLDSETRTKDFSNDVIARAQFFQQKGYK